MKAAFFAAALLIGSAAIAQDDTKPQADPAAMPSGQTVAPGNTSPELDARGIPVISDPATAPAGFNQPAGMGGPLVDASQPPAMQPATQDYPACSRTITDNCVQAYEVGRPRR